MQRRITLALTPDLRDPTTRRVFDGGYNIRFICLQRIPGYGCYALDYRQDDSGLHLEPITLEVTDSVRYLFELFVYRTGSVQPLPIALHSVNGIEIPARSLTDNQNGCVVRVIDGRLEFIDRTDYQAPISPTPR